MKPLNPLMAALVIASVGASPLRTLANDGVKTPAAVAKVDLNNPVNLLAESLKDGSEYAKDARASAGERIADFLLKPDADNKSFVASDVDVIALRAIAVDWVVKTSRDQVAVLYFVVGPGAETPAWASNNAILGKTFKPGMKWEAKLRTDLAKWTVKGGQIVKTSEAKSAEAFLNEASKLAGGVFADQRTRQEIDASIAKNDAPPVVPDTTRNTGAKLDGALHDYSLDDLYRTGAVVANVQGPKDPNARTISMKIYTKRLPSGKMVNEIGIFDITKPNDIYGQRFPLDSEDQSFELDDRTPGHKKYELKFGPSDKDGNRTIQFKRPDGGPDLNTSVSELLIKRADQAAGLGNIVNVGGQDFYVMPQGGEKSALAFFPKAVIDARGTGDARDLKPQLYAEIGQRGSDGRNEPVDPVEGGKGGPHLGTVDGKAFHLVFNEKGKFWELKDGAGDLPAPPKPATTTDGKTPPGNTTTTGPGDVTTGPANTDNTGSLPAADIEKLLPAPECVKNPDDIKDIDPKLKDLYSIVACTKGPKTTQIVIVPKSAKNPKQQLGYGSVPGFELLRARIVDHYLVLVFDKQVQYLDLLQQDVDPVTKEEKGFLLSGLVVLKTRMASEFPSMITFLDAMREYVKPTGADAGYAAVIKANVAKVAGNGDITLTGQYVDDPKVPKKVYLLINCVANNKVSEVWPNFVAPGTDSTPQATPYATLSGPNNVMEGSTASMDAPFPPDLKLAESRKATAVAGKQQSDIALYESEETPKKYFIMFKYNGQDPTKKEVFRQKGLEIFNANNPYPGDKLQIQGLLTGSPVVKNPVNAAYRYLQGSTKEKGVLAMFQEKSLKGDNQKDKEANCVGPLAWWGLKDRDEAMAACMADKL